MWSNIGGAENFTIHLDIILILQKYNVLKKIFNNNYENLNNKINIKFLFISWNKIQTLDANDVCDGRECVN